MKADPFEVEVKVVRTEKIQVAGAVFINAWTGNATHNQAIITIATDANRELHAKEDARTIFNWLRANVSLRVEVELAQLLNDFLSEDMS